jgi:two-component system CheB/CheR fusion protein
VIRELEPSSDTVESQSITEKSETAELIEYLKSELAASKENLLAVIEEREGTNEELQSYNEELQSINEEMETAREELQSTNEELTTLNDELHDKNEELNIANSDLVNFFSSVNLPFVLLDRSLRIRKFTLFAKKTLNLIEGDIGRPFSDSRFSTENGLLTLIQESLETLTQKEMEILGMDGRWYLLRVRPYKDFNDHIDGVILAFIDISELKQAVLEEKSARIYIEAIFDTIREPLVILNEEFCIQKANDAFYQLFKTTEAKTVTSSIFEIDNGQWNLPELRKLLKDILPNKSKFEDFKVEATISGIGKITLSLNARQLLLNDGKDSLIMLAIQVANESRKKLNAAISNR